MSARRAKGAMATVGETAAGLRAILGELGAYSRALLPQYALRGYQLEAVGYEVRPGPGKVLR